MNNSVIIKHEKYGLRIVLDEKVPWEQLTAAVREKFAASREFFGEASLTLTFAGRRLTEEEEDEAVRIISEVTSIHILCVFVEDPARQEIFLRAANRSAQTRPAQPALAQAGKTLQELLKEDGEEEETDGGRKEGRCQLLMRSLRSGDIYRSERTVIVLGNVEEGAALTAGHSAIVLGSVRGVVRAGESRGGGRHFVAASDLRPKKLSVDGIIWRGKDRIFSRAFPAVAAVKNGEIVFAAFDEDVEELFL